MDLQEVKRNLNKMVAYKGIKDVYMLTGCTLRKNKEGYFYQVELQDTKHGRSVIVCKLSDITEG